MNKGFTLIELLVTVSIFVFMTALIVSRYGAFNQGTLMTNLAYDVALSVRTAQTYGVSVKGNETGSGSSQAFTGSYGVHFDTSLPNSFFIYLDANSDGHYSTGSGDTILSTYNIKQGAKLLGLCVDTDGSDCTLVPADSVTVLDVSYRRPDPSATICAVSCGQLYSVVTLSSGDGTSKRTVVLRRNGQISVNN